MHPCKKCRVTERANIKSMSKNKDLDYKKEEQKANWVLALAVRQLSQLRLATVLALACRTATVLASSIFQVRESALVLHWQCLPLVQGLRESWPGAALERESLDQLESVGSH
jgi:hypothetical protein